MKKKIISMITALACAICAVGVMPATDDMASAESYSDDFSYGDYLKYWKVDEDEDGAYDYVRIIDCDESATTVEIPAEIDNLPVTEIMDYAFSECEKLSAINVSSGNNNYISIDGVLFNKDKTELIQYPAGKSETTYTIPDSVTEIESGAFFGCTSLSGIEIPDSVTEIGSSAFFGCTSLSSIEIPDSVTSIGFYAFSGCKNLSSIEIPDSVTEIGSSAFNGTQLMENQDGINYVGKWVVGSDKDITSAEIKDGTIGIANYAFSGDKSLSGITVPEGLMYIGDSAFYDCSGIYDDGTIEIPASVVRIGDGAFQCNYDSKLIGFFNIKNPDCVLGKNCMYNAAIFGEENSILQACAEKEGIPFNPVIVTEAGEYSIELAYNSTKDILFCPSESGNYSVRTKSDKAHKTSFGNSTHYSSTYENEVDSQDELTAGSYYMINIDSKLENENFNNWNEGDLPATVKVDIYHVISESKDISELVDYDVPSYVRSDISFNLEEASNVILDISENLKHLIIHFDESGYEKSSEWKSNGIYTLESGSYMLRIYGNDNDAKLNASLTPYTSTTTVTTTSPTTSTTVSTSVSMTTDSVSSGTETTPEVTGTTTDSTAVISTDMTTDVTTTKASTADTTAGSTSVSTTSTSTSTSVSATSSPITTTVPPTTTPQVTGILGDANSDGKLDVRDAAYIARMLAQRDTEKLPKNADFNEDGQINVRDAAAIARFLAKKH